MAAPWEKYQITQSVDAMPWEKYKAKPGDSLVDKASAALQGFGQAASFGYLPQLQAVTEKYITDPLAEKVFDVPAGDTSYVSKRDKYIAEQERIQKESPMSYGAGFLGGALATPAPFAGAVKGSGFLANVGKAAGQGAITSALYNPGDEKGDVSPLQLGERVKQAGTGAAIGGTAQGTIGLLGKGVKKFTDSKKLKEAADTMAVEALGAKKKHVGQLIDKDLIDDVGEFVRKEGLVRAGESFDDVYTKTGALLDDTGQKIGAVYKQAKEAVNNPDVLSRLTQKQADELLKTEFVPELMHQEVMSIIKNEFKGKAGNKAVRQAEGALAAVKDLGSVADIDQLVAFRRSIDDLVDFDKTYRDSPIAKQALRKARAFYKQKIDQRLEALDKVLSSQGLGEISTNLKALNKKYSLGSAAQKIVKDKMESEIANRRMGLIPSIVGAGAGSANLAAEAYRGDLDPMDFVTSAGIGMGAGLLTKGARNYGPAVGTNVLSGMSKAASVADRPVRAVPELIGKVKQKSPYLERILSPEMVGDITSRGRGLLK